MQKTESLVEVIIIKIPPAFPSFPGCRGQGQRQTVILVFFSSYILFQESPTHVTWLKGKFIFSSALIYLIKISQRKYMLSGPQDLITVIPF